jgi:hypothetical protein
MLPTPQWMLTVLKRKHSNGSQSLSFRRRDVTQSPQNALCHHA